MPWPSRNDTWADCKMQTIALENKTRRRGFVRQERAERVPGSVSAFDSSWQRDFGPGLEETPALVRFTPAPGEFLPNPSLRAMLSTLQHHGFSLLPCSTFSKLILEGALT